MTNSMEEKADRPDGPGVYSTVDVSLGQRSYTIKVGSGLLSEAGRHLAEFIKGRRVFVLTDKNVELLHARDFCESLRGGNPAHIEMMSLLPGEDSKSIDGLNKVLSWLIAAGVDRKSVLITVGGGVVGDLGGFAAASVLRGIDFIQVPTSLLAQVDSAVGGKTGINMPAGKNLVGAFYQPRAVLCDLDTLKTLPEREIRAGYAEILKYGLIDDAEFLIWLESHGKDVVALDMADVEKAVVTSCRKKAEIVAQDERESGIRALLNFGHTVAHALEAACGYGDRLLHGEAVAIGMVCNLMLSYSLGYCNEDTLERPLKHLKAVGLPVSMAEIDLPPDIEAVDIMTLMRTDKKAVDGKLAFILARKIGHTFTAHDLDDDEILHVLGKSLKGDIL